MNSGPELFPRNSRFSDWWLRMIPTRESTSALALVQRSSPQSTQGSNIADHHFHQFARILAQQRVDILTQLERAVLDERRSFGRSRRMAEM